MKFVRQHVKEVNISNSFSSFFFLLFLFLFFSFPGETGSRLFELNFFLNRKQHRSRHNL